MSPEEQQIAIAAAVEAATGLIHHQPTPEEVYTGSYYQYWPNYLYDLNACHLVEEAKLTTPELQEVYCGWLDFITFHSGKPVHKGRHGRYSATAAQRVEALLRTFNLYIST